MKLTTQRLKDLIREELEKIVEGPWSDAADKRALDKLRAQEKYRMRQLKRKEMELKNDPRNRVGDLGGGYLTPDADSQRTSHKKTEREKMDAPVQGRLEKKAAKLIADQGAPELKSEDFQTVGAVKANLSKYLVKNAKYVADQVGSTAATIRAFGEELRTMDPEKVIVLLPDLKKTLGSQFEKGIKERNLLRKLESFMTFGGFRE